MAKARDGGKACQVQGAERQPVGAEPRQNGMMEERSAQAGARVRSWGSLPREAMEVV